jgi:hypothetical protein
MSAAGWELAQVSWTIRNAREETGREISTQREAEELRRGLDSFNIETA